MKIVVALSGGVDSTIAAFKLKEAGHEVIGITIKTWATEECGNSDEKMCCSLDAIQFARSVAEEMNIPFYVVDFSSEFNEFVKKYFIEKYSEGKTPNPCIYCNSKLKFGLLLKKTLEMGAEKIATGHYARIINIDEKYFLAEAIDSWQDQSYFLFNISDKNLKYIEFPLGNLSKNEVRKIAQDNGFISAGRKSSQDVCFTTLSGGYRDYILKTRKDLFIPGNIIDSDGNILGKHKGIAAYTVGQRKGIGVSGHEPFYVIKISVHDNTIMIGEKKKALKTKMIVSDINFLTHIHHDSLANYSVKVRYKGSKYRASVNFIDDNKAIVEFEEPIFAPTPGQAAVFYDGEIVVFGAWINEIVV